MNQHYDSAGNPLRSDVPELPKAVKVSCSGVNAALTELSYDSLLDCWFLHKYGMLIGIEKDGYTHT